MTAVAVVTPWCHQCDSECHFGEEVAMLRVSDQPVEEIGPMHRRCAEVLVRVEEERQAALAKTPAATSR